MLAIMPCLLLKEDSSKDEEVLMVGSLSFF
jgi:hypothetical protein